MKPGDEITIKTLPHHGRKAKILSIEGAVTWVEIEGAHKVGLLTWTLEANDERTSR